MNYLQVDNLSKSFGDLILFENLSFSIDKDQKMALVARNGAGKTSLLKILGGKDTPDSGQVIFKKDISVGFLEQEPEVHLELTVIDEVFYSSNQRVEAIKCYEEACHSTDPQKLEKAIHQMDLLKAWDFEVKIKQILDKLKIRDFNQKVAELSGGQRKRLALANVLINEPNVLILDEPTNHLDVDMIEWLEEYLKNSKSTLIMVTHDRYFLDRVCDVLFELDNQQLYRYKGNYSYFLQKREERIQLQNTEIEKARSLYKRELDWINRTPSARTTKAKYRVDSFEDVKEAAYRKNDSNEVRIEVQSSRLGSKILEIDHLCKSFGSKTVVNNFTYKFSRFEKIGIVGENGTGKTTLLNLLTGNLQPDSGTVDMGSTVVIGYYTQAGIEFDESKKVIEVIQELSEDIKLGDGKKVSASQFLNHFLFPPAMHYSYVYKLSGGEKRRLYLMTVLMKNPNFLILDEPTNDLDLMTLNILEDYLQNFQGCVIIVSHDRFFMDKIADTLLILEPGGNVSLFPGTYTQLRQIKSKEIPVAKKEEKTPENTPMEAVTAVKTKLTFKERQEYEKLTAEIEKLESEKQITYELLSSGNLVGDEIVKASKKYQELDAEIEQKSDRWLYLSDFS